MEAVLLTLLQQAKAAGSSASLSFTTVGGTLKAKFKIDLASTSSPPASSIPTATTTTPAPGGDRRHRRRRRHRGPAAVAHSHARAAAHQASLAAVKSGTAPVSLPPRPPPPPSLNRRLVKVVERKVDFSRPSFSQLDGKGCSDDDSFSSPPSPTAPPPPPPSPPIHHLQRLQSTTFCTISIVATTTYTASINGCLHSADERR